MPDFIFLPSNIKMRAMMSGTAGQCSRTGNANTAKTLPPTSPHKHIHMYAHINPEQTIQWDLGASYAVMTSLEYGNL